MMDGGDDTTPVHLFHTNTFFNSSTVSTLFNETTTTEQAVKAFLPCSNPENILDKATAQRVETMMSMTVLPLIETFGVITNVINCLVFAKQGLKDRINLCLFSLAVADISFLLLIFTAKCFGYLSLIREDLGDFWSKRYLGTVLGPMLGTMNISNLMTMIISVERCVCVLAPFTAKRFLKTRYMAVVIITMAAYVLGFYSLLNMKYVTVRVHEPTLNTSRWVSRLSDFYLDNRVVIDILYNHLLSLTIPCLSLAVVVVATSLTVLRLRAAVAWKQGTASVGGDGGGGGGGGGGKKGTSGERREAAVTKMLTVVCIIYLATITPSVTQAFFRTLVPGYLPAGKYCNLFVVIQTMAHVCEVTNSSVNFIVYFSMGTRFRHTAMELCCRRCHCCRCCGRQLASEQSPAASEAVTVVSQSV